MAFYQDFEKKSKEQKRQSAQMRGGFEDEGARYGGDKKPRGKREEGPRTQEGGSRGPARGKPVSGRPASGRPASGRPASGKPFADRPMSERPYQGKPAQGKPYQGKPSGGPGRKPAPGKRGPEGEYRFATGAPQRVTERGTGMAPRPYSEQRQARQQEGAFEARRPGRPAAFQRFERAPRAEKAPYAPKAPRSLPKEARPVPRSAEAYRYDAPPAYDAPTGWEAADAVPPENLLSGRNPIREALKSGRDIEKLLVARGELSGSAREIVQMAKERHIPVQEVDRARLDAITQNHQGMLAFASAYQYKTVEDMLALAKEREEAPFLVLLDGITDPHNLGAIIRSAECAGAHGVIVQERRAVGLTPAAVKASAGAVEYIPVARVVNLTATIETLQKQNIWVFAADMEGQDYAQTDFGGPIALVIGAEGEGVSRRVLEAADKRIALPIRGKLDSLNASVAAGILLYAVMRAR